MRFDIRLLLLDCFHRGAMRAQHNLRGEGYRAETQSDWPAQSLAHGRDKLLFSAAARRGYTSLHTAHASRLANHQADLRSRDHGEERAAGPASHSFLRDVHAGQHVIVYCFRDGQDTDRGECIDAATALPVIQQVRGCQIQPGERDRFVSTNALVYRGQFHHAERVRPRRRLRCACLWPAGYPDGAIEQVDRK